MPLHFSSGRKPNFWLSSSAKTKKGKAKAFPFFIFADDRTPGTPAGSWQICHFTSPPDESQTFGFLHQQKQKKERLKPFLFLFLPMTGLRALPPVRGKYATSLLLRTKAKLLAFFISKNKKRKG